MYKLLVVTDRPEVAGAFESVTNWELMGFRAPRIMSTVEEAVNWLPCHHADGIAIELPYEQAIALVLELLAHYPLIPVMRAAADPAVIRADVMELGQILNTVHADYSDDRYDKAEKFQLCRHAYFRDLLSGKVHDADAMVRHLRLLRSMMDTDRACVLVQLGLPEDDGYLADHWRYGPDRLEVAMRNLFGAELAGMRILVSVLPDERLFLLACPMTGQKAPEDERELVDVVLGQTQASIEHVRDYLNIDLSIASVQVLPSLQALVTEDQ